MVKSKLFSAQIHQWLQANRVQGETLLKRLVQANSIQGNEKQAQAIIIETLTKIGLKIDMWEPGGSELTEHPYFSSPRTDFSGSPNVIGILKGTGGGRSIILNGHIDVVPIGDRKQWKHDPFSGEIIDGRLYGRGATDMKGGNVSLLLAISAIRALGIPLKGDVIFQSVIEEESGGAGTLAAILRGYRADAAIIPEPTNLKIFPKQQGSLWFRLLVKGRAAHGGTRYEGVSAIEKALVVINQIKELERKRNSLITDPLFNGIPIPIPINLGRIQGGDWPSSVPDLVKLEGRLGVSPEEEIAEAKNELESWLERLQEIDSWFAENPVEVEWFGARWVPGSIDVNHELVHVITSTYEKVIGRKPIIEASPWGTDGGLLTKLGGIPTIVFGPGTTEEAHFPNESIEIEKVFDAAEIIALTMIEWCET